MIVIYVHVINVNKLLSSGRFFPVSNIFFTAYLLNNMHQGATYATKNIK